MVMVFSIAGIYFIYAVYLRYVGLPLANGTSSFEVRLLAACEYVCLLLANETFPCEVRLLAVGDWYFFI